MEIKLIEVKHDVCKLFKAGERLYQSFINPNYYHQMDSESPECAFDITIADKYGGRDEYFEEIGVMDHKDTQLFKVTEETNKKKLESMYARIVELEKELRIIRHESILLEDILK